MPTVLVREGRNPYEVMTSVGVAVITVWAVAHGESPSVSVQETLDHSQRVTWSLLCFAGAITTLVGLYWPRNPIMGLHIERAGQVMLAFSTAAYLTALCTVSTFDRSGVVMTIGCAITVGAAWRAWRIWRGLRRIKARSMGALA